MGKRQVSFFIENELFKDFSKKYIDIDKLFQLPSPPLLPEKTALDRCFGVIYNCNTNYYFVLHL